MIGEVHKDLLLLGRGGMRRGEGALRRCVVEVFPYEEVSKWKRKRKREGWYR